MATPFNRLSCIALRHSSRIPSRRKIFPPIATFQNLHTKTTGRKDDPPKPFIFQVSSLSPDEQNAYNLLSPQEKLEYEDDSRKLYEHMNSPAVVAALTAEASKAAAEVSQEIYPEDFRLPRIKAGFMAMGEEDVQGTGEDDDFDGDDITSLAHGELEQHREMRQYARIAAWEMPLLSKFARPFVPPPPDRPLRFRYTTYMGETHPAEKKIVVEFCTGDLPGLTEAQRIKLIKLVGPRYNPETDIVKMSCEMFETQAQNKRYLGDLVDTLMVEAKDETDKFEDVPLDFRHHKFKRKIQFPKQWEHTPGRVSGLRSKRHEMAHKQRLRELEGKVVDGAEVIENWLKKTAPKEPNPLLVEERSAKAKPLGRLGGQRKPRFR